MEFVVVTGLSVQAKPGQCMRWKTSAFFCVDNLPPALIPVFYDLCVKSEGLMGRVAVVTGHQGRGAVQILLYRNGSIKAGKNGNIRSCFSIPLTRCWSTVSKRRAASIRFPMI